MLLWHTLSRTVSYSLLLDTLVASSRPGQIVSLIGLYSVFFRLKYTVDLPPTCYMGAHPNVHPNNQHRHLFILQASRVEPCLSKELNAGIVSGL